MIEFRDGEALSGEWLVVVRSHVVAFRGQMSIATLTDLERSKVVFLADGVSARPTRDFPSKTAITVLTERTWTRVLLQIEGVLR